MIQTPNMQIALPFEDNVTDVGKAGLTWTPNGATSEGYTAGKIGSAYAFANPSNYLSGGNQNNPCNITDEFTWACWINTPWGVSVFDLGVDFTNNRGIALQLASSNGNAIFAIVSDATALYGLASGRWNTGIPVTASTPTFLCGTRNATDANMYKFNGTAWSSATQAITTGAGNMAFVAGNSYNIGTLIQPAGSPTNSMQSGWLDQFQIFNKALNFTDVQRIMLGMHPLNG